MTTKNTGHDSADSSVGSGQPLRKQAEQIARRDAVVVPESLEAISPEATRKLLLELRVHQIELETQNEDLRQAQAELEASRARYFDLYDLAPVGYCTLSEEGLILEANLTVATLLGTARGELVRQSLTRFILPEDQDLYYQHRKQLFETGEPQVCELRMLRQDSAPFWARLESTAAQDPSTSSGQAADGAPGCRVVLSDITERKEMAEAVIESNNFLTNVINAIADPVFVKDRQHRWILLNDSYCSFMGCGRGELIGKSDYDFFPACEADVFRQKDEEVFASGIENENEERFTDAKGTTHTIITKKSRYVDVSGHQLLVGVIRDVTERKRAEQEMAKLEAQLQQAQKMESVGRLAGGVAHDFNNMLGVILCHTEMAIDQTDPAQPLFANLEQIRMAANRSADFTRQLLAFARKQTIAPRVLDLNETVECMLTMLARLIGEDIHLTWQPKANLWPVKVDPSQIDQILANLCVNARDSIPDVGKVTIQTGNSTFDENYCAVHASFVPGEYVLLAVSDDGCGMDKQTLAMIFEPFFTTKAVGKGTGLGLATVYGIVKQNNGFIDVYSEPGQGTTFKIYLPRHVDKAAPMEKEASAVPAAHGHETILLVEDEPAMLAITTIMLEKQGYTVLAASTPGEAIRLARERAGEIHLLLTDVVLPEMNGLHLAKNLMSLYPHLKHLFMSGYTADVIARHGVLDEGVYFIQKPFSIKELVAKVREALGGAAHKTGIPL